MRVCNLRKNNTETPQPGLLFRIKVSDAFAVVVLCCVLVILVAFAMFFSFGRISGKSMAPTLTEGDVVVTKKIRGGESLRYGDIIGFETDRVILSEDSAELLKRIVGLPGDLVEISGGFVLVNGETLDLACKCSNRINLLRLRACDVPDSFYGNSDYRAGLDEGGFTVSWTVPEGHVFVLGDNIHKSVDSRVLGPIPFEDVHSLVVLY